jgi:hypothetical protein
MPKLCAYGWRCLEGFAGLWWTQASNGEGIAYDEQLEKHTFNSWNLPYNLPICIVLKLEDKFTKRWNMMLMDVYYAGALLNPYLKDNMDIQENDDMKHALNKVVHNLSVVPGVRFNDAKAELTEYEERRGPYNPLEALDFIKANLETTPMVA